MACTLALLLLLRPQSVDDLLRQLGDSNPEVRDAAQTKLRSMGEAVEANLRKAAEGSDVETRSRAKVLVRAIELRRGGRIAYIREISDRRKDLYRIDFDGGNPLVLAEDVWDDHAWCADGTKVAFISRGALWTVDADGRNAKNLTNSVVEGRVETFQWSPDGRRIVFDREGNERKLDKPLTRMIHVIDADGTNHRQLTKDTDFEWQPVWSPDGKSIAFAHCDSYKIKSEADVIWIEYVMDLHVMSADGCDRHRLTKLGRRLTDLTWSPDGKRVLFEARDDSGENLYSVGTDGTDLKRLAHSAGFLGRPLWLSDGARLLYYLHEEKKQRIVTLDVTSLETRELNGPDEMIRNDSPDIQLSDPAVSPAGKRVAFRWYQTIYVADADGRNLKKIASDAALLSHVSWGRVRE